MPGPGAWSGSGPLETAKVSADQSAIRDVEKYNAAALLGWRVIRTVPAMVRSGAALVLVEVALGKRSVGEVL